MKNIIVYFSYSGNTDKLIKETNKVFGYDVVRVERSVPYSDDYDTCAYVEAKKEWKERVCPEINDINVDFSGYDNVLLFFPIWWYTYPMPIATFVKTKLAGFKGNVYAFANSYTNDKQYMVNSMKDLKELDSKISFKEGLFNKSAKDHIEFIKNL